MLTVTIISAVMALLMAALAAYVVLTRQRDDREKDSAMACLRQELEQLRRESAYQFQNVAAETLEKSAGRQRQENLLQLETVLSPLRSRLDDFSKAMRDSTIDAAAARRTLSSQIEQLMRLNVTIGDEARKLAAALKGNTRIQGNWGEMVLESILEREGLAKNLNYRTQLTRNPDGSAIRTEEGNARRPDVVLLLPGKRSLVIDSKVSLTAYLDYCSADDSESAAASAKKHVESVKKHIDELGRKEYQKTLQDSAEFVVMFIPNDGAFIAAMQNGPELWDYASARKVVIASPSHLMTIVKLAAQLWRQENQKCNALEIARIAGLLYDKVAAFATDMKNVERNLGLAEKSYREAYSKLTSGPTSVLARAERLRDLGARTSRRIDSGMLTDMELNSSDAGSDLDKNIYPAPDEG